jgi:arginine deiminase
LEKIMTDYKLGVHSETGQLRQVIVSPPGLAHRRLTPENCGDLLFDDVFWVKQAIKDHGQFSETLRGEGVEVLDAMVLLAQTLDLPKARAWVLDHRITRNDVGVGMRAALRAWMDELPGADLAAYLVGGIRVADLPFTPAGMFGSYLGQSGFVLPPLPNFILTRENSAWVYGGVTLNPMYWQARRPETLLMAAVYRFHAKFTGARVWFGDPTKEFGAATLEGGDIMPIGHGVVMVGMGERSSPQAVGQLAEALFKGGEVHRLIACQMLRSRAAMHLDTVFTHCGGDVVTTFKEVADAITCYDLRPGQGKEALDTRQDPRHLFEITAEILGHKKTASGSHRRRGCSRAITRTVERRQQRAGRPPRRGHRLCRNDDTNAALKAAGIEFLAIPGAELGRGRGGSHCMSCPTIRDAI